MTSATATVDDVASFDGRFFPVGDYRRIIRVIGESVVLGLGSVAAVGLLVATVTLAAAWLVNTALSTNPLHARAPIGPGTLALANPYPTLASALAFPARVAAAPADAPPVTFAARWAPTTASTPSGAVPLVPQRRLARAVIAPAPPRPLVPPHRQAKPEIAHAPDLTQVAKLTPPMASAPASSLPRPTQLTSESANSVPLPRPHPAQPDITPSPVEKAAPQVAVAPPPPPSTAEKRVTPQQAPNKSMALPAPDSRTAVYDIAAHTVYLPNGERLEAHSGLGSKLDDPRYVKVKNWGPTPPNVYDLSLREELFHGVRAIRLNPVDDGKMFGRDGMLAHSYMLGANGQSNGCVSFKDYRKFLNAYLNGEVDRLVVVPELGNTSWRTAARHGYARRSPVRRYASNNRYAAPNSVTW
jgi:hypothetical protein